MPRQSDDYGPTQKRGRTKYAVVAALLGATCSVTYYMSSKSTANRGDLAQLTTYVYASDSNEGGYNYGSGDEFETVAGGGYSGEGGDYDAQVTRSVDENGEVHGQVVVQIDNENYQDVIVQDWDEGDHGGSGGGYGGYGGYGGAASSYTAEPVYVEAEPQTVSDGYYVVSGGDGGYNYGGSSEFETQAGGGYNGPDANVNANVTRSVDSSGEVQGQVVVDIDTPYYQDQIVQNWSEGDHGYSNGRPGPSAAYGSFRHGDGGGYYTSGNRRYGTYAYGAEGAYRHGRTRTRYFTDYGTGAPLATRYDAACLGTDLYDQYLNELDGFYDVMDEYYDLLDDYNDMLIDLDSARYDEWSLEQDRFYDAQDAYYDEYDDYHDHRGIYRQNDWYDYHPEALAAIGGQVAYNTGRHGFPEFPVWYNTMYPDSDMNIQSSSFATFDYWRATRYPEDWDIQEFPTFETWYGAEPEFPDCGTWIAEQNDALVAEQSISVDSLDYQSEVNEAPVSTSDSQQDSEDNSESNETQTLQPIEQVAVVEETSTPEVPEVIAIEQTTSQPEAAVEDPVVVNVDTGAVQQQNPYEPVDVDIYINSEEWEDADAETDGDGVNVEIGVADGQTETNAPEITIDIDVADRHSARISDDSED